jgi:hypothetical protein
LRSSLEDSLESRTGVSLEHVDEDTAVEFLREFGKPQDVAASYRTGLDYLVGPTNFASFIRTLKISLAVVGGLIALGTLIDIVGSSGDLEELGRIGGRFITDIQTGFLALFGLVVLVFAIIERRPGRQETATDEWDPHDLPPIADDTDRVDRTETVVGLVLAGTALLLINIYPDWFRIHVFSDGEQFSVPLVGSVLRAEVFIFNIYLALGSAVGVFVLVQGRWRPETRIADVGVSAILVLFLSRLLTKADVLLPGRPELLEAGWPAEQAASFAEVTDDVLSPLLWWLLLAGLLLALWGSVRKIAAAIRTGKGEPNGRGS